MVRRESAHALAPLAGTILVDETNTGRPPSDIKENRGLGAKLRSYASGAFQELAYVAFIDARKLGLS
jgi:hypothetical protein